VTNKILLGFPLYKNIPAKVFGRFLGMNKEHVMGTIMVEGVYIATSMGMMVQRALDIPDWTRLTIFEADMLPPNDALDRVATYGDDMPIVGSMYFSHGTPHHPVVYIEQEGSFNPVTSQTVRAWCSEPALYSVDAVGMGFTSIARHVLEDWPEDMSMFHSDTQVNSRFPWDDPEEAANHIGSHDLWFCKQARALGHRVFVDSAVICGHLTETATGYEHNQAFEMPDESDVFEFAR
jgi:hypothetical protein